MANSKGTMNNHATMLLLLDNKEKSYYLEYGRRLFRYTPHKSKAKYGEMSILSTGDMFFVVGHPFTLEEAVRLIYAGWDTDTISELHTPLN